MYFVKSEISEYSHIVLHPKNVVLLFLENH